MCSKNGTTYLYKVVLSVLYIIRSCYGTIFLYLGTSVFMIDQAMR